MLGCSLAVFGDVRALEWSLFAGEIEVHSSHCSLCKKVIDSRNDSLLVVGKKNDSSSRRVILAVFSRTIHECTRYNALWKF